MPRLGTFRLFGRQLAADRGALLTVTVVVLVVSALLAAWPRAIEHMFSEEVREQVTDSSPRLRDITGQTTVALPWREEHAEATPIDTYYAEFRAGLDSMRAEAGPLLATVLGDPGYHLVAESEALTDHVPDAYNLGVMLATVADPAYAEHVRLVEGELPAGVERAEHSEDLEALRDEILDEYESHLNEIGLDEDEIAGELELYGDGLDVRPYFIDVALTADVAAALEWPIGQLRTMRHPHEGVAPFVGPQRHARLTGIVEPLDPDDPYWSHARSLLQVYEEIDFDRGTRAWAHGYVEPTAHGSGASSWFTVTAHVWLPVDGSRLTAAHAPVLLDELRAFSARGHRLGLDAQADSGFGNVMRIGSGTVNTLQDTLSRQASATALLGLVAAGPFGVALAVLALGARLLVERRRRAMALVSARGASTRQLRGVLTVEGLVLGVPAAALAVAAAQWLVPGHGGVLGVALPLVVGLAPAVLLPVVARPGVLRAQRSDLSTRRRGRFRWALEALVIVLAIVSVVLLHQRGLTTGEPGAGIDPLIVATPLLVALAVCVIVLRFYALPVAALARAFKRRSGLVGFVGTVRAVRDPAAGLAPALALIIGLSVAVFSTVLWSTTQTGGASSSIAEVGADLRVDGQVFAPEQVEAVAGLPDVASVAAVSDLGIAELRSGNRRTSARVFVADTAALADVQSGLRGVATITHGLAELDGGALPVMVSDGFAAVGDAGELNLSRDVDVLVAGTAGEIAGMQAVGDWILVDEQALDAVGARFIRPPRTLLIGAEPAVGSVDEDQVATLLDDNAQFSAAVDVLAEVRAGAVGTGLMASFAVAVAAVGVLSAVAVLLTMVIAAPSRGRLFSQLRTLGLSGHQAQGLATWEMAPLALVALLFGTGLGVGTPYLLFSAVDLRPLTGTDNQPPIVIDWALVGIAAAAFVLIVAIAVAAAVASSRRLRLGTVLRVGEDV